MSDYYILDADRKAVPTDVRTWGRWHADINNRRVAVTQVGNIRVSTVCLGLDHSFGDGPPQLFESMAFGSPADEDEWQERCETWEQAEAMHAAMVERAKSVPQTDRSPTETSKD